MLFTNCIFLAILTIFTFFSHGLSHATPCLEGCTCERVNNDRIIRCDDLGLTHFPLPHSTPLKDYHFLALTCNDIETIPSTAMIKAAFPDLQGIDVQGNNRLNCSDLAHLDIEIPVLSDCESEKPMVCENLDKNCDWKCRSLAKLKEMWARFKELVNSKIKEWGAEEHVEAAKSWFSKQFKKFSIALGDLSE